MKKLLLVQLRHSNEIANFHELDSLEHISNHVHIIDNNMTNNDIRIFAEQQAKEYYGIENFTEISEGTNGNSYFFFKMACCVSVENCVIISETEFNLLNKLNIIE